MALLVIFSGLTLVGYSSGILTPEETGFLEKLLIWLESIDLNALHATLAAILGAVIVLIRLFVKKQNRFKRDSN